MLLGTFGGRKMSKAVRATVSTNTSGYNMLLAMMHDLVGNNLVTSSEGSSADSSILFLQAALPRLSMLILRCCFHSIFWAPHIGSAQKTANSKEGSISCTVLHQGVAKATML